MLLEIDEIGKTLCPFNLKLPHKYWQASEAPIVELGSYYCVMNCEHAGVGNGIYNKFIDCAHEDLKIHIPKIAGY